MGPPPALVAGACFSMSVFLLIDGFLTAQRDPQSEYHFTFLMWIPLIVSFLGFLFFNLTAPDQMSEDGNEKALTFIFVGWVLQFGATVSALALCAVFFVGASERKSGFPGVAIVGQTLLLAISGSALWASKKRQQ